MEGPRAKGSICVFEKPKENQSDFSVVKKGEKSLKTVEPSQGGPSEPQPGLGAGVSGHSK